MGTISGVWDRLKPLLLSAKASTPAAGAKADSKRAASDIDHFMSEFTSVLKQLEAVYAKKAEVDKSFKATSEKGLSLLTPMLQKLDAAHKDGFNPGSNHDTLDDRMHEMIDRLKELKTYASQTQWD